MSVAKQLILSLVVVALVAAGWFAFQNRDRLLGASGASGGPAAQSAPGGGHQAAAGQPGHAGGAAPGARPGGFGGGPARVVLADVTTESTGEQLRAIGTLSAARAVNVYPQVSGVVVGIDFTPGAPVATGDPLIRLDSDAEAIALDKARLDLSTAEEAKARAERLAGSGSITDVALADARSAYEAAQIGLRSAQLALDRRTVRAPFAGVTGLTEIDVGDLVSSQTLVTTLDDLSTLRASFAVPQRFADQMTLGTKVSLAPEGAAGLPATVTAIGSRVDEATRTFQVEATLDASDGTLKPGMAVVASVDFPGEDQPAVPSLAIQWDRQGSFVWTVPEDKAHRTPVTILTRRSGSVLIAGELQPGDQVVVEGVQRLREGAQVARVEDPAAGPVASSAGAGS
jgi:RND family efflux transporter MFP subunit